MTNLYVVNSQKPTAVSHSISCNFSGKGEKDLILAKGNILEFYTFTNGKLELLLEAPVFGEILSLLSVPSKPVKKFSEEKNQEKDFVFVLLSRKFCLLEYDQDLNIVKTRSIGSLKDIEMKELESGYLALIDPSASVICTKVYSGVLKFIPFDDNNLFEPFSLTFPDSNILDIKFLYTTSPNPVLAILSEDLNKVRSLRTYELNLDKKLLNPFSLTANSRDLSINVERSSCLIIPVQIGGAIIIGLTHISYIFSNQVSSPKIISVEISPTTITSYTQISESASTFLLGDYRGRLILLQLQTETANNVTRVKNIVLKLVGITSISENLSYLNNGHLFLGSVYGDSQLLKIIKSVESSKSTVANEGDHDEIDEEPHTKKKKFKNDDYHNPNSFPFSTPQSSTQISLQIIDEFPNLGPIFDMCLTQGGNSSSDYSDMRKQLVTCSGAYKEGSLKILRSGVGIEETVSTSVENLKNIWTLKDPSFTYHKFLIQSYLYETKIFQYLTYNNQAEGELIELNLLNKPSFEFGESTLFSSEIFNFYVQVTPSKILLINNESLDQVCKLDNNNKDNNYLNLNSNVNNDLFNQFNIHNTNITHAKLFDNYLIISYTFGWLAIYQIHSNGSFELSSINKYDNDIACFSAYLQKNQNIPETEAQMEIVTEDNVNNIYLLAISFWGEKNLKFFNFFTLELINTINIGSDIQARDLLLVSFPSKVSKKIYDKNISSSTNDNNLYIFIGLGDGFLITYVLDFNLNFLEFKQRKKTFLGTKPISFRIFNDFNGEFCVFAICDSPAIIVERYKKLSFSELDYLKGKVRCITPFHTQEGSKNGVILGTENSLVIGSIEGIAKLHLQKISLPQVGQEFCNKIIYLSEINVYALISTKINNANTSQSNKNDDVTSEENFKKASKDNTSINRLFLLNGRDFQLLDSFEFDSLESPLSITSITITSSPNASSFVVGTGYVSPSTRESKQGRLLFFSVSESKTIWLLGERIIRGPVTSLCTIQTPDKVVACIGSNVHVYSIEKINKEEENASSNSSQSTILYNHINFVAECYHSGYVLALLSKSYGNHILIGDLIRSIVHLVYDEENKLLVEISRDYNTHYLRAIEILGNIKDSNYSKLMANSSSTTPTITSSSLDQMEIDSNSPSSSSAYTLNEPLFVAFDDSANLMSFKEGTLTPNEVNKILLNSEYHNGSLPNVIIRGSLVNNYYNENDLDSSSNTNDNGKSTNSFYNIYHPDYQSVTGYSLQDKNTQCIYGTISGSIGNIMALSDSSYSFFLAVESSLKLLLSLSTTYSMTKVNPLKSNDKLFNLLSNHNKNSDDEDDLTYLAHDNEWLLTIPNYLGLGDFIHEEWRSFTNSSRYQKSTKVIDGDLIEAALTLPQPALALLTRLVNEELTYNQTYKTYFNTDSYLKINQQNKSDKLKEDEYYSRVCFTPYEIIRRIEDINRAH